MDIYIIYISIYYIEYSRFKKMHGIIIQNKKTYVPQEIPLQYLECKTTINDMEYYVIDKKSCRKNTKMFLLS